jgi:phosphomannomutase/phosphoglucomutase
MLKSKGKKTRSANNLQGISARGNALRSHALIALLIVLVPSVLGLSYLAALRETAIRDQQVERVAESFAAQQASRIAQLFSRLEDRMRGAARSPLALSAIASRSGNDIAIVEQAMLDYFPEVVSLRLMPMTDMGTAELAGGTGGLRNHTEVDMVRRTAEGMQTLPESYEFEGTWLTSFAYLVAHPRIAERTAVIIATIDNSLIADELQATAGAVGRSVVQQIYEKGNTRRVTDIAATGSGNQEQFARVQRIEGTPWQLVFTPSIQMVGALSNSPHAVYGVLALVILTAVAAFAFLVNRFANTLGTEVNRVISAAEKKTSLELQIPELVGIAKQLRRATLRTVGQPPAVPTDGKSVPQAPLPQAELFNPLFQSVSILDEEDEEEVLELDLAGEEPPGTVQEGFPDHIFRAYDIRGIAKTELDDEMVTLIGRAIGTLAGEKNQQTIIVAADGRTSSPRIKTALMKALLASGRDVIDIGEVPTPVLYFATRHLECGSGVMVTGSHNPGDCNGLKIVFDRQTIAAGGIREIRDKVRVGSFSEGSGRMLRESVVEDYINEVVSDIAIAVPLKIVIDAGNGVAGSVAPRLFEELGCDVVPMYCDVDGRFPNHPPDTSNEDNLADLIARVTEENADFGVALDGDGDRLAVVTGSGEIVRSDRLLMLFADDVVSRNPGADVVFDVKCSRQLTRLISSKGGRPVLWKTGHAFMKEKMRETGALLGGEFSGHMFFGERWYGFDDGMYAAGRLAEILGILGRSLDEALAGYPQTVNTPEILIPVDETRKFEVIRRLAESADFSPGKVSTLDGVRVDYSHGWGLLRASNTSPNLTARFEADTEEAMATIKQAFRDQMALVDPGLELTI